MCKKSVLIPVLILSFSIFTACAQKLQTATLKIQTQDKRELKIKVELAITQEERNHGFMERKKIPDGTGMLFIFERDQILSFWMKNTPHPLSIAYIDKNGKIRDIFDMTPYSLASVTSTVSVRYALEVPQGWFAKNNVKEGDFLILP
ncbi:DUF192 domain-containing protein [Treponema pectinovorum]|uniref:DUF192 domain-containing protein n=1 Tax=Treponema pectinovorum TaxID=164 RepID=UPI0011CC99D6|nr:DUF192 domain-containing protein [Treponema pectinovorum]